MIESAKPDEILLYMGHKGRVIWIHSGKSATLEMLEGPLENTEATIKFKNLTKGDA